MPTAQLEAVADLSLWESMLREGGEIVAVIFAITLSIILVCKYGLIPLARAFADGMASNREGAIEVKNAAMCARDAAAASERSSERAQETAAACERIAERLFARAETT